MKRLAAPNESGGMLASPGFDAIPSLLAQNKATLDRLPPPLAELRRQAAADLQRLLGISVGQPLIFTGHQPELFHPGVWAKHFVAIGIAERCGGVAINLLVDSDLARNPVISLPGVPARSLAIDEHPRDMPYERREILNPSLVSSFADRLAAASADWPFRPLGIEAWKRASAGSGNLGRLLASVQQGVEQAWGLHLIELPISRVAEMACFAWFVQTMSAHLARFRTVYNSALADYRRRHQLRSRNHPAQDLAPGELPFWRITAHGRETATPEDPVHLLRPKALILTLFARLVMGDLFIHGLGGGLYDEATDRIIRDFFGVEPPAYQVVTGTLHLPFTLPPAVDLHGLQQLRRDLIWNPQRHLVQPHPLSHRHRELQASQPAASRERKGRFREFQTIREALQPFVEATRLAVEEKITQGLAVARLRSSFLRRDYAWVLYPESVLRPFLERFRQAW